MYRETLPDGMAPLLTIETAVPDHTGSAILQSWAPYFYENICLKINESNFKVLYCQDNGRPNAPISQIVAMEILKEINDWSDEQLLEAVQTDLRMMRAIGITSLEQQAPSARTLYYFRKALVEYENESGVNLLELTFALLTDALIKHAKLKTTTMRMDSFHIGSNIKRMSRAKIFHKVIRNFMRILPGESQTGMPEIVELVKTDEDKALFDVKPSEYAALLKRYAETAFALREKYSLDESIVATKEYKLLDRVLREHTRITDKKVEVLPAKEVSPASLQNPADPEAIYNKKNTTATQGYKASVTETCDSDNAVNLITHVALYDNNVSDEKIPVREIGDLKSRNEIETLITDGGFPSEESEKACAAVGVTLMATEVKGRKQEKEISTADFSISAQGDVIACPEGHAPEKQANNENRIVAHFDKGTCLPCPRRGDCLVSTRKKSCVFRVSRRRVVLDKRRIMLGSKEFQRVANLRPPVEGAVSQLKPKYLCGRSLFRGKKQIACRLFYGAMGANFRRLWVRLGSKTRKGLPALLDFLQQIFMAGNIVKIPA